LLQNGILYEILILIKITSSNICDFQIVTNLTNHIYGLIKGIAGIIK